MIREVAKSSLSRDQVKVINQQIASVVEEQLKSDNAQSTISYPTLAEYFLGAGDYYKAVDYFSKGAESLSGNGNNQPALYLYHRAIELVEKHFPDQVDTLVELLTTTSKVACLSENFQAGLNILERALEILKAAKKKKLSSRINKVMKEMGRIKRLQGQLPEGRKILMSVFKNLSKRDTPELHIEVLREIGIIAYEQGQYDEALQFYQSALQKARKIRDFLLIAYCLNEIGTVYLVRAELGKALNCFVESLELREKSGNQHSMAVILPNIARTSHAIGETSMAMKHIQQALSISQKIGDRRSQVIALINLGDFLIDQQKFKEASMHYQVCLKLAKELGFREVSNEATINLGLIEILDGDLPNGRILIEKGLANARDMGSVDAEVLALTALAIAEHKKDDFQSAAKFFQNALKISKKVADKNLTQLVTNRMQEYPTRVD
jgi:tetratricopeptide (TPR) repeat protein